MNRTGIVGVLVVAAVCSMGMAQRPPSAVESAMVKAVDAETPAAIGLLEKLVNINSGTMNFAGVVAVKDVVAPQIEALGFKVDWTTMESLDGRAGDLVAEHACPAGAGKCGKRLLLIGHMDTVFEPSSSFQRVFDCAWDERQCGYGARRERYERRTRGDADGVEGDEGGRDAG